MENRNLLHTMEKCGHFLWHRRGGRRGQLKILEILDKRQNMTQTELSQLLTLKTGSVSETVKKLENSGYITKKKNPGDKRQLNLEITEAGREFLREHLSKQRSQEEVLFYALTEAEQETLQLLLEKLLADWEVRFDSELFHSHGNRA